MQKIFIIFIIFLSSFLFSQKIEFKSDVQIVYSLVFKPGSIQTKTAEDIAIVYINNDKKESIYQASKKKKLDSLIQVMEITKFPSRPMYIINHVIKKDIANSNLSYTEVIDNINFGYSESIKELHWALHDSERKILGFKCKMAKLNFRGRYYTAWYCPSLPIQDGPYKFAGLPGMILEIYDNKNNFHFQALAIEEKPLSILYDIKHKEISRVTLLQTKMSTIEKTTLKNIRLNPIELN